MNLILLVAAILCFLVATLLGFDWAIHGSHQPGWVALGLLFFAASFLVGPALTLVRRE